MKLRRKWKRSFYSFVLAIFSFGIIAFSKIPSSAAEIASHEKKIGSITITMEEDIHREIESGRIRLYKVDDPSTIPGSNPMSMTRGEMAAYIEQQINAGKEGQIYYLDKNGHLAINNLEEGSYILLQDQPIEGYEPFVPFLVNIPMEHNGDLLYDIVVIPKLEKTQHAGLPEDNPQDATQDATQEENPSKNIQDDMPAGDNSKADTVKGMRLPQTGQLWWPVCLLLVMGLGFVGYGSLQSKRK